MSWLHFSTDMFHFFVEYCYLCSIFMFPGHKAITLEYHEGCCTVRFLVGEVGVEAYYCMTLHLHFLLSQQKI